MVGEKVRAVTEESFAAATEICSHLSIPTLLLTVRGHSLYICYLKEQSLGDLPREMV
jgi:hypothetical protein